MLASTHLPRPPLASSSIVDMTTLEEVMRRSSFRFNVSEVVQASFANTKTAYNQRIVMVIGATGAGKSTLINYLSGCYYDGDRDEVSLREGGEEITSVRGELKISETLYASAYRLPPMPGFAFCDCPGFFDNRTEAERVTSSLSTEIALRSSAACAAIMIVIDFPSMKSGQGGQFLEVARTVSQLLKIPANMQGAAEQPAASGSTEGRGSILFVITQAQGVSPDRVTKEIRAFYETTVTNIRRLEERLRDNDPAWSAEDNQRLTHLRESILPLLTMMRACPQNILIENPAEEKTREAIFRFLEEARPIPKEYFDFSSYDPVRARFDNLLIELATTAASQLRRETDLTQHLIDTQMRIEANRKRIQALEKEELGEQKATNQLAIERLIREIEGPEEAPVIEENFPLDEKKLGFQPAIAYCFLKKDELDSDERLPLPYRNISTTEKSLRLVWRSGKACELKYDEGVKFCEAELYINNHSVVSFGDGKKGVRLADGSLSTNSGWFTEEDSNPETGQYRVTYNTESMIGIFIVSAIGSPPWLALGFLGPLGWTIGLGIAIAGATSIVGMGVAAEVSDAFTEAAGVRIWIAKRDEPHNAARLTMINAEIRRLESLLDEKMAEKHRLEEDNARIDYAISHLSSIELDASARAEEMEKSKKDRRAALEQEIQELEASMDQDEREQILLRVEIDHHSGLLDVLSRIYENILNVDFLNLAQLRRAYQIKYLELPIVTASSSTTFALAAEDPSASAATSSAAGPSRPV